VQIASCARDRHVEQASFFGELLGRFGKDERHQPLADADHGHRVPFQALRRVHRRQRDRLTDWRLLPGRAQGELVVDLGQ